MKYERLTDKRLALLKNTFRQSKSKEEYLELARIASKVDNTEIYNRLAELEDKIEQGTLKEVVRCKDCRFLEEKHYEDEGEKPYVKLVCKLLKKQFQPNDFCSYAEKRLKELQE